MHKWKQGMMRISPLQLAQVEFYSILGSIIGTIVASVLLILFGLWYVVLALIFTVGIQGSQAVGKWQQIQQLKILEKFKEQNIITNLMEVQNV
jgi:uncharacterized membrane protein